MKDNKQPEDKINFLPIGMSTGLSIGIVIGAALGNIPLYMCVGLAVGVALGALTDHNQHKSDKPDQDEENADENENTPE